MVIEGPPSEVEAAECRERAEAVRQHGQVLAEAGGECCKAGLQAACTAIRTARSSAAVATTSRQRFNQASAVEQGYST